MKNKYILLIIILLLISGVGLLELGLNWLGGVILGTSTLCFILFPLICDFLKD